MKRFFKSLLFTCLTIVAFVGVFYIASLWSDFTLTLNVGYRVQMFIYLIPFFISTIVCIFLLFYGRFQENMRCRDAVETEDEVHELDQKAKEFYERTKEILKDKTMSKEVVCNWIPVSEGLPDEGRLFNEYLITVTRWSDVVCEWIEDDVILSKFYGGKFDICRCFWEDGHQPIVKAWMELPKPYKLEG